MRERSFTTQGIVLKRTNVGESDRILNLLTPDMGKITCVAKGVRKLHSSRRASFEPGNYIKAFLIKTKSLPLLTQASVLSDCQRMEPSLKNLRQLSQLLEILEKLFVEAEIESEVFDQVLHLRQTVIDRPHATGSVRRGLGTLITSLGFQDPRESAYATISDYVSALSDQPLRSFHYLQVK